MIEFIKTCGFFGLLILLFTLLLVIANILVACLARSRKALAVLALAALLPLLLGLIGTAAGYAHIEQVAQQTTAADSNMVQRGREEARYTSYLGVGCTVFLFGLIAVTIAIKKPSQQSDDPNRAAPRRLS